MSNLMGGNGSSKGGNVQGDDVMSFIRMARNGNPNQVISMLFQQFPKEAKMAQDLINAGRNPMQAVLQIMRQRGMDPETVLKGMF